MSFWKLTSLCVLCLRRNALCLCSELVTPKTAHAHWCFWELKTFLPLNVAVASLRRIPVSHYTVNIQPIILRNKKKHCAVKRIRMVSWISRNVHNVLRETRSMLFATVELFFFFLQEPKSNLIYLDLYMRNRWGWLVLLVVLSHNPICGGGNCIEIASGW